jgi:dihydrodipicolinate synthase/N-acetylneuraminate lyase
MSCPNPDNSSHRQYRLPNRYNLTKPEGATAVNLPDLEPLSMLKPRRQIHGISAILLPFTESGEVDWPAFDAHLLRTAEAGLTPAVDMDTGFVHLLDGETYRNVLRRAQSVLDGRAFVAGAFVSDQPGAKFDLAGYQRQIGHIQRAGGLPILFQSFGLVELPPDKLVAAYCEIGRTCEQFLAFELTPMLAPFGAIYDLETFAGLLDIPQCVGEKHSSFQREPEWQRLRLRDQRRPDFTIYTGNDFAIDMVMYGSDYLLGLSTFAPDLFAQRDAYWSAGDPRFFELNDQLQYLGMFAFRAPSAAYKHSAAQFLKLRGWLACNRTHAGSPSRPASDIDVLRELGQRLGVIGEC